jgi:putative ATP-grasp target RiPP
MTNASHLDIHLESNPLSSGALRYQLRQVVVSADSGPAATRPFGLHRALTVPTPVRPSYRYCPLQQVAVDDDGEPLVETKGKDWKTKGSTDGDEGVEENWGWEES